MCGDIPIAKKKAGGGKVAIRKSNERVANLPCLFSVLTARRIKLHLIFKWTGSNEAQNMIENTTRIGTPENRGRRDPAGAVRGP